VHRYVQLARMKRASHQLAYMDALDVTEIAIDAGYEAPDAFARAFRQRFGQSPSSFRKSPDWEPWLAAFGPLDNARSKLMQKTFTTDDVTIRDVQPTKVAIMEHRGSPETLGDTIRRFIAWRRAAGLHPRTNPTFTVWHSEGRPAQQDEYSIDLCVGTDQPIEANDEAIKAGEIPGGRCAVLRVVGYTDNLEPAALYLYRDWLPASGEEARDFPIYCQRLSLFPEVPEHETIADVFLPLK
jgi:AraC family transcriptional regulator